MHGKQVYVQLLIFRGFLCSGAMAQQRHSQHWPLALGPPPSLCDWARTATPATQGLPGVVENELLSEQTSRVSKTFKLWQQLQRLISQDP